VEAVHDMTHRRWMIQRPRLPIFSSSIIDAESTTYGISRLAVNCIEKEEFAGIVCFVGRNRNVEVVCMRESRECSNIRSEVRRIREPYGYTSGQHLCCEPEVF